MTSIGRGAVTNEWTRKRIIDIPACIASSCATIMLLLLRGANERLKWQFLLNPIHFPPLSVFCMHWSWMVFPSNGTTNCYWPFHRQAQKCLLRCLMMSVGLVTNQPFVANCPPLGLLIVSSTVINFGNVPFRLDVFCVTSLVSNYKSFEVWVRSQRTRTQNVVMVMMMMPAGCAMVALFEWLDACLAWFAGIEDHL